ncbi:hypothetical protein FJZ17_00125 [Candidatus Pacearchaeota archaeon]|nr:hypothetical protein [Candidatus Pacearchaeota archaeon]
MKNFIKNKKGDEIISKQLIFLILNLIFLLAIMFFIVRASTGAAVLEETSAKTVAILIDSMKPGTEANFSLTKLYDFAEKNRYSGQVISIDSNTNTIHIQVLGSGGYNFQFLSSSKSFSYYVDKSQENQEVLVLKKV